MVTCLVGCLFFWLMVASLVVLWLVACYFFGWWLPVWLVNCLFSWLVASLFGQLVASLLGRLVASLIGGWLLFWLVGGLFGWLHVWLVGGCLLG